MYSKRSRAETSTSTELKNMKTKRILCSESFLAKPGHCSPSMLFGVKTGASLPEQSVRRENILENILENI